jgi:thiol:disulfide interchange protein
MNIRIFTLLIALLSILPGIGFSQIEIPVKWQYKVVNLPDNHAEIQFIASIQDKWHLYSQKTPDGGPLPLLFEFEASQDYERIGEVSEPKPLEEYDDIFKVNTLYFKGNVTFKQKIKILSSKGFNVIGFADYQACIDGKCVPGNEEFNIAVNGGSSQNTAPQTKTEQPVKSFAVAEMNIPSGDQVATQPEASSGDIIHTSESESIPSQTSPIILEENSDIPLATEDENKGLLFFFLISFLAGLAAILTPCVFPMIPMTVTFFMKDKENKAKGKAQALVYGFSIIAIYTFIGSILAVVAGPEFANFLSTHWIPNVLFFLIFVFFAASFLGMFEIVLPSSLINKSDAKADKGGFIGAIFMAVTLVLVSFSCTGPIVGAILVESAGGAILKPIVGMFGFSLAFALPFTLFAFFPGWLSNLPKSGGWLNSVKVVLGFIELALGLKFLSVADQTYHWGILDREVYLALWIVIFTLMGLYLLGKLKFSHDSNMPFIKVPRLMLAIATFSFVVYLIPGMFGAPLKALSGYLPPSSTHDFDIDDKLIENSFMIQDQLQNAAPSSSIASINTPCDKPKYADYLHLPHSLKGYFDYDQALECARKQNKPLFIDFTGHGCVNCREMEANVWADPQVLQKLKNDYVVVALYVDDKKIQLPEDEWVTSTFDGKVKKTLGKKYSDFQISRYNVNAQPYYVLLDKKEQVLVQPRGYNLNVNEFVEFLDKGIAEFNKRENNQ